jgi:hypothetical protein
MKENENLTESAISQVEVKWAEMKRTLRSMSKSELLRIIKDQLYYSAEQQSANIALVQLANKLSSLIPAEKLEELKIQNKEKEISK